MRERMPSQTAAMVAMLRALADRGYTHVEGFRDPVAQALLTGVWSGAFHLADRTFARMQPQIRDRIIDALDIVAARVRAIDEELESAVAEGARQVVILGAGLDTRAFRMRVLADSDVFEVDHPATQGFKACRAATLPVVAKSLRFVKVDFEREALEPALKAAGFDATRRSVWIWEGVVMYLTDAALSETLRSVAMLSAEGSRLLVQYHEPDSSQGPAPWTRWFTRGVSEPQIGLRTRAEMSGVVETAGFKLIRDEVTGAQSRIARLLVAQR
jgi:methyltransferase (TIGR00027 family)